MWDTPHLPLAGLVPEAVNLERMILTLVVRESVGPVVVLEGLGLPVPGQRFDTVSLLRMMMLIPRSRRLMRMTRQQKKS